jgi:BirA family transcriptional regulator, biotin operon repressor / biotin---[acetyl-CoA-carboxylase] ligase
VELREFRTELPSTQIEGIRRAREGAPEGARIVAARQSAGRGRGDHAWASPAGNLYLSLIVRAPSEHRSLLPLAVGARLRAALAGRYGAVCVLKWPNDLLVLGRGSPRKLSGILVDIVPSPTLDVAAVIGIGVNVSAPPEAYSSDLRARVVSLAEITGTSPDLGEVERVTVAAAESAVAAIGSVRGVNKILAECRAALHGVGRRATVDSTLAGTIRTVGEDGELWLDTPSGAVSIRSGDLVVEDA